MNQYKCDNIDLLRDVLEFMKRKQQVEKYHVWQGKNGYWYSKVDGRLIKKKERWKLEEEIGVIYTENQTIKEVFDEWIESKTYNQPATIMRYKQTFKKFFDPTRRVRDITEWDIECFIKDILDSGIKAKEWGNVRTVLFGIFKLARKQGIIHYRISEVVEDINISPKQFLKPKPKKQVLNNKEHELTIKYLTEHQENIRSLGILLILFTGLRSGELCGLRMKNLHSDYIKVESMEIKTPQGIKVVDKTKTDCSNRKVYIPTHYQWIIKELRKNNPFREFVFMEDDKPIRTDSFRNYWNKVCDKLGIERTGLHALRKTYASMLLQNGADKLLITAQMGHADFTTTAKHYIKDVMTEEEKILQLEKVL